MSIIKSISVGNGDMFYIKHCSSNFTIIDCNMDETNKKEITEKLQKALAKSDAKSYNMVTERNATPFWFMKSFSSCF